MGEEMFIVTHDEEYHKVEYNDIKEGSDNLDLAMITFLTKGTYETANIVALQSNNADTSFLTVKQV